MQFISVEFLIFVIATLFAYFLVPKKIRWIILLLASYVFYILTDFWLIIFIVITSVSVYFSARLFEKTNESEKAFFASCDEEFLKENKKTLQKKYAKKKKRFLVLALLLNFGILGVFKYFSFVADAFNAIFSLFSVSPIGVFNLLLPLGISFYTFQSIGYLIDVYYGKQKAEKNLFKFSLFTSFFPQLLQGPISRFDQLAPQLFEGHDFSYKRLKDGLLLIGWGLFKKLCIADTAFIFYNAMANNIEAFAGLEIVAAVLFFMAYAYCSFSGGIDMARGISHILGIELVDNFERPHFATGVGDYWHRWHKTLGSWMKDYVLYPITLSKTFGKINKKFRARFKNNFGRIFPTCCVMFFVFLLVGIWHGAEFKWIVFGLYNGFFVSLGIFMKEPIAKFAKKFPKFTKKNVFVRIGATLLAMFIVFWSRLLSSCPDVTTTFKWIGRIFSNSRTRDFTDFFTFAGATVSQLWGLLICVGLLFGVSLMQEKGIKIREFIARRNIAVRWLIYLSFITIVVLFASGVSSGGFLYERL